MFVDFDLPSVVGERYGTGGGWGAVGLTILVNSRRSLLPRIVLSIIAHPPSRKEAYSSKSIIYLWLLKGTEDREPPRYPWGSVMIFMATRYKKKNDLSNF